MYPNDRSLVTTNHPLPWILYFSHTSLRTESYRLISSKSETYAGKIKCMHYACYRAQNLQGYKLEPPSWLTMNELLTYCSVTCTQRTYLYKVYLQSMQGTFPKHGAFTQQGTCYAHTTYSVQSIAIAFSMASRKGEAFCIFRFRWYSF